MQLDYVLESASQQAIRTFCGLRILGSLLEAVRFAGRNLLQICVDLIKIEIHHVAGVEQARPVLLQFLLDFIDGLSNRNIICRSR
jgi:hypothetical protein